MLATWGSLIKRPPRRGSWLHVAASLLLGRLIVGHWLGLSAYRSLDEISAGQSLMIFSPALTAALAAFILSPDRRSDEPLDLSAHYFRVSRWIFPLLAAFTILAGVSDLLIPGREPFPLWFYGAWAATLLLPAFTASPWTHALVIGASLLVPLAFAAVARAGS